MGLHLALAALSASLLLLSPSAGNYPETTTTSSPNRIHYPNNPVQVNPLVTNNALGATLHDHDGLGVHLHLGDINDHAHTVKATTTTTVAPTSCHYWCKTPQGSYYCCPGGWPTAAPVTVKPGLCPVVRPVCPKLYGPPVRCTRDTTCAGDDKCCFDVCLQEKVCKPPRARKANGKK